MTKNKEEFYLFFTKKESGGVKLSETAEIINVALDALFIPVKSDFLAGKLIS